MDGGGAGGVQDRFPVKPIFCFVRLSWGCYTDAPTKNFSHLITNQKNGSRNGSAEPALIYFLHRMIILNI